MSEVESSHCRTAFRLFRLLPFAETFRLLPFGATSFLLPVILCFAFLTLACSGSQEPEPLPSQTVTQVAPQLAAPPPLPVPVRAIRPTRPSVKVIDAGGDDEQPKTLLEASRLAKARKQQDTRESIATINDDNLHEYAKRAEMITLESPPAAPKPELEPPPVEEGTQVRDEQYWRSRALELRMGWRRTFDQIGELELESAALRQQFYAEDDPYIRDSQLKPAWDRALDRLDQLRDQSARYEQELETFITEGQRTGALQGWLNQGWELEPTPDERKSAERVTSHEAVDLPIGGVPNEPEEYDP